MSSQVDAGVNSELISGISRTIPEDTQIQVRFRSRLPHYAITDSIIAVPARLHRYGLSEIINHLLATTKPIPFDFLIDGQFLRTSLAQFMQARSISPVSQDRSPGDLSSTHVFYSHIHWHVIGIGH